MRAVVYDSSGAGETLRLEEIERPVPKDNEVLIKVRAASVNPLDYHLSAHPFLRRVLLGRSKVTTTRKSKRKVARAGRDVTGQVEAVGGNVTLFKPGDEVFGACNGSFAEYVCAREAALAMKPSGVSFEHAAALPVAGLTALQGLRDKAKIQSGQKVLINGAAGGVGTFAVQIAKSLRAHVTGVCSTRNLEMVQSIGANKVIDYTREDFTSSGEQYDLIFDLVSNHSFAEHRRALTQGGMYIGAGILAHHGSIMGMLNARLTEFVRSPFVSQRFVTVLARLKREDLNTLASLIVAGKLTPVIDRRYPLREALEAVRYVEEKHARGKVVIDCQS